MEFYKHGMARLDEQWDEFGEQGARFMDAAHPYAQDLDLFGKGSLFQLLSRARTRGGEDRLAAWMKSPASLDTIRSRQGAVSELRANLDLREDLAVLGPDMNAGVEPELLRRWAQGPATLPPRLVQVIAALIGLLAIASLVIWAFFGEHLWFFLMILIEVAFVFCLRRYVRPVVHAAEKACAELNLFSNVLARLEKEKFSTGHLMSLRAVLDCEGIPPSRLISRLDQWITLLDSRRNQLFAPFAFLLLWEIQLAFFVENWRRKHGHNIAGWLDATAEFEALSSLAGYAYENPVDPFPEFSEQPPCFDARGLGHPMLAKAKCVRNDLTIAGDTRAFVVSGSNMSGKSTLLRTVGINAVLAMAGAPVRAASLKLSPLALGASIRINDSLKEGTSRFYAEIMRLKQLVTIADGPVPLMFLLDELLHGTNSHDRRIGAEAIIKGLVQKGAIGLLTTHDLALAHIVDELSPQAVNVHFEDHIENGRVMFDYHLREGIVRKSNALELMRSIGLQV
jgi:DNA mismatch repair ATPase MutS